MGGVPGGAGQGRNVVYQLGVCLPYRTSAMAQRELLVRAVPLRWEASLL